MRRYAAMGGGGAAAGALAALTFAAVHALLISDIWYSLVAMLAAGAVCGATIGWSYGRLSRAIDPELAGLQRQLRDRARGSRGDVGGGIRAQDHHG